MRHLTKHKILFVDDEQHWREMVSTSLAKAGFDVLAASDGSEAMLQAADASLGLIIVDEDLAGESGIMLTKFLRRNHPDVPTMLYTTTEHDADTTLDIMNQGADLCLLKGSMEELLVNVGCYAR
jgi:two-component system, OmpR family, response regulator